MTTSSENLLTALETLLCHVSTELLTQAMSLLRHELESRPDCNQLFTLWQVDDVRGQRPDLTEEQCRQVLCAIKRGHDATIGINWDVIDAVADILYPEPENLLELRKQYEA